MNQIQTASRSAVCGFIALISMSLTPTAAFAQSATGTVQSTITLTSACAINGSTATSAVNFGTLAFGSTTTLFTSVDAAIAGSTSAGIAIQCTPGTVVNLRFVSGLHDGAALGGTRAMSNGTLFVPYDLYSNAGRTTPLLFATNLPLTADGTVQTLPVYGRALGVAGLAAGTYTDTISVTLTF